MTNVVLNDGVGVGGGSVVLTDGVTITPQPFVTRGEDLFVDGLLRSPVVGGDY